MPVLPLKPRGPPTAKGEGRLPRGCAHGWRWPEDEEVRTMDSMDHGRARTPEDLHRLFVERANAGDLDGLVSLYEPDAVVAFPPGRVSRGHAEIRATYRQLLASRPQFALGNQLPALLVGDLALTIVHLASGGATAEVARRHPDGTWRWVIDHPSIISP
jgi:ketosteroid isomerase-like protein